MVERIVVFLMVVAIVSGIMSAMANEKHECDFCIHNYTEVSK